MKKKLALIFLFLIALCFPNGVLATTPAANVTLQSDWPFMVLLND